MRRGDSRRDLPVLQSILLDDLEIVAPAGSSNQDAHSAASSRTSSSLRDIIDDEATGSETLGAILCSQQEDEGEMASGGGWSDHSQTVARDEEYLQDLAFFTQLEARARQRGNSANQDLGSGGEAPPVAVAQGGMSRAMEASL